MRELNQEELMNEISDRIKKIRSYTPKVGVFGNSGVGKSSLCNALFGKDIAKISDVEACTRKPQEILIGAQGNSCGITLVDVPGIGEDPVHQKEYTALYRSLVPELDLVLWAIKADDRNYASGLDAYKTVFDHKEAPPVIFVITQTDKTNDADDWNRQEYLPGGSQEGNIAKKENDVSKRFDVSTKNIISIAVQVKDEKLTGRSYNLKSLVDRVVEALPNEKKYSFTREAKEENVSQEARIIAEKGIWDSVKEMAGKAWDSVKEKVVDTLIASAPKIISTVGRWIKGWF
ncbi:GTPase family protein [Paracidovorax avenae]|uniref:GTPase family protein n=1 Tax=Paracidovorax avenae TaxID=80867 RepID=UPI001AD833FD|nr:GTPase [Paracidovorax avenae]